MHRRFFMRGTKERVSLTIALAGDTMLGRGVAERLTEVPPASLVSPEVVEVARGADLFVLNLECCISERGSKWPDPAKPFFFRAPPAAVEFLVHLGVDCVTLANNHALDFGEEALIDTLKHLDDAGIGHVGAGEDQEAARSPLILRAGDSSLAVLGASDHPQGFAAGPATPGIAFADFLTGTADWVGETLARTEADFSLVTPHWGPNMTAEPVPHVRSASVELAAAGATLVAGHSAHVFHGIEGRVLYDLGDFLDDYAVDPIMRNDLGLLFLVTVDGNGPRRLEGLPLKLDFCVTRAAEGDDATWIRQRFRAACADLGTKVTEEDGRVVVTWS
jgi:poly-gamma-glutamate capsule biosynthesis protein CapA/YwtB (metallophosphatase superfamily)